MQAIRHFQNDSPEMSESKEFAAAMIILSAKARIYWRLVVMHEVIWTDRLPTAGTDGIYIYINPAFFMGLPSDSQRAFLLGHEVGHMILRHPQRGKAFRKRGYFRIVKGSKIPFDHKTYNCAGDYVINADLVAHGLEPIPSGLFDDRFTRDHLVDEVYAELYEEQQQESDQQESDDTAGDESEASDSAESGESGESGKSDDESGDESGESGDEAGDESGSEHEGHDVHLEPKYDGTAEEVAEAEREDERALDKSVKDGAEQQQQAIKEGEHADVTFGDGVAGSLRAAQER